MRKTLSLLVAALLAGAANADFDVQAERERAEQAVAAFAGALKSELMAAMQSGGPVAAIGVCNTRAPEIAGSLSLEASMTISRTSLKYRNPDNSAETWTGRGRQPKWVAAALASGKSLDDLKI